MNRGDIEQMTNEELCLHIAEKVTGQELARPIGEHFVTHDMAMDAGDMSYEGQSMGLEWEQIEPYPYTNDIAAAWAVVEAMREKGWTPFIDGAVLGKWYCSFIKDDGFKNTGVVLDESVCVAICKAALFAVLMDEGIY